MAAGQSEHSPAGPDEARPSDDEQPPHRRRRLRAWKIVTVLALVLFCVALGGLYAVTEHLADKVNRVPSVFDSLDPTQRPSAASPTQGSGAQRLTFLVAGSDSGSPDDHTTGSEAQGGGFDPRGLRSDVIMLASFAPDRTAATVVSIPRDSWVPVPGHGMAKVNAAYSFGGPTLMVQTVEQLTGIRIDHFAAIDFAGFEALTDAVGGIDVAVARPTTFGTIAFHAGVNHLNGRQALAYVRQRYGLPGGDLDRVRRHQSAMRALISKLFPNGSLSNPVDTYRVIDLLTRYVSVDDTLTNEKLRSLAIGLHGLRPSAITFMTAPIAGLGQVGDQSVVHLDHGRGATLWRALSEDRIAQYLETNSSDVLGSTPR
jgi:LCP family protein required for cell wall assembly